MWNKIIKLIICMIEWNKLYYKFCIVINNIDIFILSYIPIFIHIISNSTYLVKCTWYKTEQTVMTFGNVTMKILSFKFIWTKYHEPSMDGYFLILWKTSAKWKKSKNFAIEYNFLNNSSIRSSPSVKKAYFFCLYLI